MQMDGHNECAGAHVNIANATNTNGMYLTKAETHKNILRNNKNAYSAVMHIRENGKQFWYDIIRKGELGITLWNIKKDLTTDSRLKEGVWNTLNLHLVNIRAFFVIIVEKVKNVP